MCKQKYTYLVFFSVLTFLGVFNVYISTFWMLNHQILDQSGNLYQSSWDIHELSNEINFSNRQQQQRGDQKLVPMFNTSMLSCIRQDTICRYDDIGQFLEFNQNDKYLTPFPIPGGIIHKPLSCIPKHRRIPHEKANDWPYILQQRNAPPDDGSMTALMDYNAMLIPLYRNIQGTDNLVSDLDPIILNQLTGKYHPYFSKYDVNQVKYLSITRSSNLHACKPRFKFSFGTLAQDYLGISLLDENLQRIQGTDIAINVDKWILGNMTAVFHDFRLEVVKSTKGKNLKDQFFLLASGHLGTYGFPIDIRRVPPGGSSYTSTPLPWNTFKVHGKAVPLASEFQYGDGMEVRFIDDPDRFAKFKDYRRGDLLFKDRGIDRGKNFHIFESKAGDAFMETWPHGYGPSKAHVVVPIHLLATSFEPQSKLKLFHNRTVKAMKGRRDQVVFHDEIQSKNGDPMTSFKTVIPKHLRPNMKFRGTSQLIDMTLDGVHVKVGIAHTVAEGGFDTKKNRTHTDFRVYLSQFYAFSPESPFETIAISGMFCFHHMMETDDGYHHQWISKRPVHNRTFPILVLNDEMKCPLITFATGMIEMIGHGGNNVIITYGVDDCYSRSIVVPKKKIEMLLLGSI